MPVTACIGAMPAAVKSALASHTVVSAPGDAFFPLALAGQMIVGQLNATPSQPTGLGELDPRTGGWRSLSPMPPNAAGVGSVDVALPWLVWQEGDSSSQQDDWTVHALNLNTDRSLLLATSQVRDGGFLPGPLPLPVVRGNEAAWAQPVSAGTSEVKVENLDSGATKILAEGLLSSPAFAGPYLLWAQKGAAGTTSFHAVGARSLAPIRLPGALRGTQSVLYLAGSSQYFIWSRDDQSGLSGLMVWRIGQSKVREYVAAGQVAPFQFMQLAGHYVLWNTGIAAFLMDLRDGSGFQAPGGSAGAVPALAGSSQYLVLSTRRNNPSTKVGPAQSSVATVPLGSLPTLPPCGS